MHFKDEMIIGHKCEFPIEVGESPTDVKCLICGKGIMDDYVHMIPEAEKPLEFVKYRSVHNTYLESMVDRVIIEGLNAYSWMATNKYHGTNFSIMCSASALVPCAKNGPIPEGHSHYGHEKMMPYLSKIIWQMQSYFGKNIQVFFELFGGSYPHKDVLQDKRFKRIAKGVFYCPTIDVRVIDIKVNGVYLDWDEMVEIAERHQLRPAKVMKRGSFDQLMELDPVFEDPTYKEYNLPKLADNMSEGYVLRPTKELQFKNGRRCILKSKNPKFKEKANKTKKFKTQEPMSDIEQLAFDNLSACVTDNRLQNIISHGEKYEEKDFQRLLVDFWLDILKEEKEEEYFLALDKLARKGIMKQIRYQIADLIRPIFTNNLDF